MKQARVLLLAASLFALAACDAVTGGPGSSPYVGDWRYELTAYDIDGGGVVGSGTVSVTSAAAPEYGTSKTQAVWDNCTGWCSPDGSGTGTVWFIDNGQREAASVVLEGTTPAESRPGTAWMDALQMDKAGQNAYEGNASFGICQTGTECYAGTKIALTKVSDTPTLTAP